LCSLKGEASQLQEGFAVLLGLLSVLFGKAHLSW